jgi:hypothetical protein
MKALVTPAGQPDDSGERFGRELREVSARFDPVPERVKSRARRAVRLRAPTDSELLDLIYDSIPDPDVMTLRHAQPLRLLSFAGRGIRLDVRLDAAEAQWSLSGWTTPVRPETVRLRAEHGTTSLTVHLDGTFSANQLPRSQVSLLIEAVLSRSRRRFHSSWFAP